MTQTLIDGIDVVFIHSNDPELSQWYCDVLGVKPGYGDPHWQEYIMPSGSRFAIDAPGESPTPIEQQPIVISFGVKDIHQAVQTLIARGVKFVHSASGTIFDVGPTLVATFQDSAGHYMQLSESKQQPVPTVRTELHAGDVGTIVKWHGEWYGKTFGWGAQFESYVAMPLSEFVLRDNPRERIWIVEYEGEVTGCVCIVEADPETAQLRWFFVDEVLRGQGWGRKLTELALAFASEQGYTKIILWTVEGLDAACHLYESYGFSVEETHTASPWGSPVTEIKYTLKL